MSIEKIVNVPEPPKPENMSIKELLMDGHNKYVEELRPQICTFPYFEFLADYLVNHGVTVQTETPPQEPTKETEENQKKTVVCPVCGDNRTRMQFDLHRNVFIHVCDGCGLRWEAEGNLPTLNDSGSRREFDTGAVRDIAEGKGRCDLLPLGVISSILPQCDGDSDSVLFHLREFQEGGDAEEQLVEAIWEFSEMHWKNRETMLLELAIHFEEGAKKYGEYNWQKGIPVHCYLDSAVRHYLKWLRGDKDEPHDRAFVWNLVCCLWTIKHKPELCDIPHKEKQ